MASYREPAVETPIRGEYDVIVGGAGPAGFAAAVCAARQGARTLLLEQLGDVGGIATSGLMSHWTGGTEGPLYREILTRHHASATKYIDTERLKTLLLEMLAEAGVALRLYSPCVKPMVDGARVTGVVTESKSGREAFRGAVVVDATGDGDLAARAGADFAKGRADGGMQPVTLMFKVAGVDTERAVLPGGFETNPEVPGGRIQELGKAHLPFPAGHVLLYRATLPGVVTVNMTNVTGIDGTDAESLTRGTLACRRQIEAIVPFLRRWVPGFADCYLLTSAALLGVRETRHIAGDYTLTAEDIAEARVFDDWVVTRAHFNFDIHNVTGSGLDADGAQRAFTQRKKYTIPYGCFLPRGLDGLLLAGRDISGTHKAHSNYRVMPICVNMGQAAGTAAALAARANLPPRQVDVREIQSALRAQGVEE